LYVAYTVDFNLNASQ